MVLVARGDIDSVAWSPWSWRQQDSFNHPKRWARRVVDSLHTWEPFSDQQVPDVTGASGWETVEEDAEVLWPKGIEIDSEEDEDDGSEYWIQDLHLTLSDKRELLDGSMLSDKHILAAQRLLTETFPHLGGFQDTCLSQLSFKAVTTDSVQIHHTRGSHWVVTSWRQGDVVELYDSLYDEISPDLMRQIQDIYVSARRDSRTGDVLVRQVELPKQRGYRDCGLFAIAIALELCQDYDVSDVVFKQEAMRKHLLRCLRNRRLESFPQR